MGRGGVTDETNQEALAGAVGFSLDWEVGSMFAFVDGFRDNLGGRDGCADGGEKSCSPTRVGRFVNPIVPRRETGHAYLRPGPNLISLVNRSLGQRGLCRDKPRPQPILVNPESTYSKYRDSQDCVPFRQKVILESNMGSCSIGRVGVSGAKSLRSHKQVKPTLVVESPRQHFQNRRLSSITISTEGPSP